MMADPDEEHPDSAAWKQWSEAIREIAIELNLPESSYGPNASLQVCKDAIIVKIKQLKGK